MTPQQAEVLMTAIAQVAQEMTPYLTRDSDIADNPEEASDIRDGFQAVRRQLATAVLDIQALHPEVVHRWRHKR